MVHQGREWVSLKCRRGAGAKLPTALWQSGFNGHGWSTCEIKQVRVIMGEKKISCGGRRVRYGVYGPWHGRGVEAGNDRGMGGAWAVLKAMTVSLERVKLKVSL